MLGELMKKEKFYLKCTGRLLLIITILTGVVLRTWACLRAFGIWWKGDEAEYVNMAWLMVHGYGWPSLDLRSPFYPIFLTIPIKMAYLFGLHGESVMLTCRLFNMLFSIILLFAVYAFAKKMYSEKVAKIATLLMSFSAPIIEWTPRVMTEIPSISFLMLSLMMASYSIEKKSLPLMILSGLTLGCAYLVRFNFAIFLIPFLLYLLIHKEGCLSYGLTLGFLLTLIIGGFLDYSVWGTFLHAPIRFFEVNVIAKCEHTDLDVFYYVRNITWYITPVGVILGIFCFKKSKATIFMLGLISCYLLMISFTPNYDLRYGLAIVPFALILMADGLLQFRYFIEKISEHFSLVKSKSLKMLEKLLPHLMLALTICLSLVQVFNATYAFNVDATKAALYLNEQSDVVGVITIDYACKMGEYIYLQKNVPIYEYTTQDISVLQTFCEKANYVIVINEWYLQIRPDAREVVKSFGFAEIQRYNDVYVLKKS
jgi:4-amino-4-deoxy-L-arabinose transferase-like glycosyltransferase